VANAHFATDRRVLIVADVPGDEQSPRDLAAAWTADLAVLLTDARKGLLPQTRYHGRSGWVQEVKEPIVSFTAAVAQSSQGGCGRRSTGSITRGEDS
jgi:sulfate adenylyltransferase subunit 1 (EFTu-like GTPase family)